MILTEWYEGLHYLADPPAQVVETPWTCRFLYLIIAPAFTCYAAGMFLQLAAGSRQLKGVRDPCMKM